MASSERDNAVRQRMLWRDSSKTGYLFSQNDYIAPEEREGYKTRWGLNEERAGKLVAEIGALMGKGLAEDGRFTRS